jgi:hypothetical protein
MASRKRTPPPTPWMLLWHELQIAGAVAGAMTLVLLARRWTQLALGTGTLNQEFFAGNLAVGTLVAAVEARMEGGTRAPRSARSRVPGGSDAS